MHKEAYLNPRYTDFATLFCKVRGMQYLGLSLAEYFEDDGVWSSKFYESTNARNHRAAKSNQAHPLNQHIAPNHNSPLQPNPHYAPAVPNQEPTYGQIPQTPNLYPPNSQYAPFSSSGQRYPQYPAMAPNPQYPAMAPNPQYPAMAPNPQYSAMAPNSQYPAMAPYPQNPAMAPNPRYPAMAPYPENPAMAPNPQYPAMAPYPQNSAMAPNPQYPAAGYPQYSAIGHPQYVPPAVQPQHVPAPPVNTESAFSRYLRYAAYGMNILGNILQIKHNHRQQKTLSQIEQHHRQLTPHGGMYPMPHHQPALPRTVHHHHEVHVIPHPHGQHVIPRAHETHVITHPNGQHVIPRAHETHVVPHPHGQHVIPRARETHVIPHTHETHILPRAHAYA
ncbi:uncharacterized protein [Bemisia tabaci]